MWDTTQIFSYAIGDQTVHADPLELHFALVDACDGDPNSLLTDIHAASEITAGAAYHKLIPAIRKAFGLPPVDPATGQGASYAFCLRVLTQFVDWELAQKKSGESAVT